MKNTLIPTLLFPYAVCLGVACMYSQFILWTFFRGNEINILIPVLIFWIISIICNCFYLHNAKTARRRSRRMLKELLAVKLWQLPAYIVIAYVGIVQVRDLRLLFEIITFTYMALVLSSFASTYAIFRSYRHHNISAKRCIIGIICQYILFVDVISLNHIYQRVNKRRRRHHES